MSDTKKLDFTNLRLRTTGDDPVSTISEMITNMKESRENTRYPINVTILNQVGNIDHMFQTENISAGGMKLNAPIDMELLDYSESLSLKLVASFNGKDYKFKIKGFVQKRDPSVVVFDKDSQVIVGLFLDVL